MKPKLQENSPRGFDGATRQLKTPDCEIVEGRFSDDDPSVIIFHDERCTGYATPGHPERPERVSQTVAHLRRAHPQWPWKVPASASREAILKAHSERHFARMIAGADFPQTSVESITSSP